MKSILKKMIIMIATASMLFLFTGCEKEGTAEKAGKKVDQTLSSLKEKIDEAKK